MLKIYSLLLNSLITIINSFIILLMGIVYIPFYFTKKYKGKGSLHILANGPSLKNDIGRIKKSIPGDSVMCVNFFATSDIYTEIKPNYYIIVDPAFYNIQKYDSPNQDGVNATIESIIGNTSWEMVFFIPYKHRNSEFVKKLNENKFINVAFIKSVPLVDGFIDVNAYFYGLGLANPLFQNVLIAGIDSAIKSRFKTIYIWGADHSWLKNISFENNNKSYIKDVHFYNKDNNVIERKWNRFDLSLLNFQRCFRAYYELELVAKKLKIKIYNCSSESWINAFERKLDS